MSGPIEVAQTGLTWGSILMSGVFSAGFLSLIGVMWKMRLPMRQLQIASDEKLRADLMSQLEKQDTDHMARVLVLEGKLEDQRKMYETRIEYDRLVHDNELQTMRHRMNNLDQCLTMLLALIEENPEKAQAAAKRVRLMREKQETAEAAEKAMLSAARVSSIAPPLPPRPTAP